MTFNPGVVDRNKPVQEEKTTGEHLGEAELELGMGKQTKTFSILKTFEDWSEGGYSDVNASSLVATDGHLWGKPQRGGWGVAGAIVDHAIICWSTIATFLPAS